jgi:peptidoglycan/LPS O-acetylase OafA/YrhL
LNVRADRFPLFDSLRAMAALSILALHSAILAGASTPGAALGRYVAKLDVGVPIFFVISGFLLYRPFVKARYLAVPSPGAAGYAWRRFLRIVPAYWVALTVILIVFHGAFTPRSVVTYYGFLQIYDKGHAGGGIAQAWTLCVEVTFYALLPLWAAAMRRLPARRPEGVVRTELVALGLLAAGSLAYNLVVALWRLHGVRYVLSPSMLILPTWLLQFAAGMALAVLSVDVSARERPPWAVRLVGRLPSLAWLAALAAFVVATLAVVPSGGPWGVYSPGQWIARQLLYTTVAVGLVLPAVFGDPAVGVVRRVLANRALLFVGLVSYPIYLWHVAVLDQLRYGWGFGAHIFIHPYVHWVLLGFACSMVVAVASYYVVEKPALRLKGLFDYTRAEEALAEPAPLVPPVVPVRRS